jgi:hypothetical protein
MLPIPAFPGRPSSARVWQKVHIKQGLGLIGRAAAGHAGAQQTDAFARCMRLSDRWRRDASGQVSG